MVDKVKQDTDSSRVISEALSGQMAAIIKNCKPVIFVIDLEGKFLLSEGRDLKALGLTAGQVVGMSAYEMYKDYPAITNGIKKALVGKSSEKQVFVKGPNGDLIFDTFFSPYSNDAGEIEGCLGMALDVTGGVEDQIELREKMEQMEAMNKLTMGRELKMVELKQRIDELEEQVKQGKL